MGDSCTVVVTKADFETQQLHGAVSYTVSCDGVLEVTFANGSTVAFTVEQWVDVDFSESHQRGST